MLWSELDSLYPPHAPPDSHTIEQKLDKFLAKPVAKIRKNIVTIKDIIEFEANVKGGVYVGDPKNKIEVVLENFPLIEYDSDSKGQRINPHRPTLRQLDSITLVTLEALSPLYNAIMSK